MNARKLETRLRWRMGGNAALSCLAFVCAFGVFLAGAASAQNSPTQAVGTQKGVEAPATTYLTITSDPPGIVVKLIGEYEFVGTTPWNLFRPVAGIYRVEASAPGYGTWSRQVVLGPTGIQDLHIKLSRKSRLSAAGRSLVFPGWGQHYNESKGKRNLVWLAETGALVATYVYWIRYQDKVDDFDRVAELYEDSRDVDAIPILRRELERRSERADDAFDSVQRAQMVAIGVYAFAFLDALFSGPEEAGSPLPSRAELDAGKDPGTSLGWAAKVDGQESRLGLRLSF
ncbi:MAG: PEGA domain-containing protein [Candidatus Eisenbacteria bacterium]|uniref:PEGA domain-containing protein n=1 Tax=Eiseniibacteriota bacterium TaxID=2212470 RepID=A0A956NC18_UNCEI|nr:PEGA domain-containing protein [Candidatus Eisenbacteria bacterium]MCB9462760.1 PEGA domain-containing protein [Candidatus Eisenbacteria bacterium]